MSENPFSENVLARLPVHFRNISVKNFSGATERWRIRPLAYYKTSEYTCQSFYKPMLRISSISLPIDDNLSTKDE